MFDCLLLLLLWVFVFFVWFCCVGGSFAVVCSFAGVAFVFVFLFELWVSLFCECLIGVAVAFTPPLVGVCVCLSFGLHVLVGVSFVVLCCCLRVFFLLWVMCCCLCLLCLVLWAFRLFVYLFCVLLVLLSPFFCGRFCLCGRACLRCSEADVLWVVCSAFVWLFLFVRGCWFVLLKLVLLTFCGRVFFFVVILVCVGVPVGCLCVVYLCLVFVVCVFFCGRVFCLLLCFLFGGCLFRLCLCFFY